MSRYAEFDISKVKAQPIAERTSLVTTRQFAKPAVSGASFAQFLDSLPDIYAGRDIRTVAERIVEARRKDKAVVVSCGGHVVKCGVAPHLITLMERGMITALAVNGAVAIHDIEIALFGATSENVDEALIAGTFGMAGETATFFNCALRAAAEEGLGAGEAIGRALATTNSPFQDLSLMAAAYTCGIPVTVHVAIGTDIVHMHPSADGAAYGETSMRDFRIVTAGMRGLTDGGVLMNIGSAVLLPEVLLKAIALLRNESLEFGAFLGVDCDFMRQHRATQQVVARAKALGGEGIALTGHHEILVPMLAFAVMDAALRPHRLTCREAGPEKELAASSRS